MSVPGTWLHNATAAARMTADRGDLWLPGALGVLPYIGWLPLVVTVGAFPRTSDLAFTGAGLISSSLFPLNVILISIVAALAVLVACLIASLAEASLLRAQGLGTPNRSLAREVEVTFSVMLLAVLPAVAVGAALVSGLAAVAPAEFGTPDLGIPLAVRIALRLAPLLAAFSLLTLLGQAFAAVALRRAIGIDARPVGDSAKAALRDLLHKPVRRFGLAVTAFVADLVTLALAVALLRVLWAPIGADLGSGDLISPTALLLLVGFVAIWLAVILTFGALHVMFSTWWSLETGALRGDAAPEAMEAQP
jgi:hypothetical protein